MTKENFANEANLKWKMTSNGRVPQMSKVKYLSNYWSDLLQIFIGEIPRESSSKSRVWLCSAQLVFILNWLIFIEAAIDVLLVLMSCIYSTKEKIAEAIKFPNFDYARSMQNSMSVLTFSYITL